MKIAVVYCGVLSWHLGRVCEAYPDHEYIWRELPSQLHNNPRRLKEWLQAEIDGLQEEEGLDGIVLGFGLCGRGIVGLQTRTVPLVVPRVQDCIGMFLGSQSRYLEQFNLRPGTRYMTQGWYERAFPEDESGGTSYYSDRDYSLYGPDFAELEAKYGTDNACFICHFRESWKRNYQRAAYIRFPREESSPPGLQVTRAAAGSLDWEFEVLDGDESLFQAMLGGRWEDPRLLVVPPQHRTVSAPGEDVIAFTSGLDSDVEEVLEDYRHRTGASRENVQRSGLALGIDTGGTFTDGVIYDFDHNDVVAWAKAETTHDELIKGVREVLAQLPEQKVRKVERVGISTTLATNAFVEHKGQPVGLLIMGPVTPNRDALPFRFVYELSGRMKIDGVEECPVDSAEIVKAAGEAVEAGCTALAVSGYGSVVNPAHELEVARVAYEATGLHAVCGHELTTELNFVERMTTAAMNARLIPLVEELLAAVSDTLQDYGLGDVRVMVVKGDGSQISADVAKQYPVETILSGPAASVVGAATLFNVPDAVVVDMGGTTTDVAMTREYVPVRSARGARIGDFCTSVRAMDIRTVGLGGDSEIDLSDWPRVTIGPRRVIPLCRLSEGNGEAGQYLREHLQQEEIVPEKHVLDLIRRTPGQSPTGRAAECVADTPRLISDVAERAGKPTPAYLEWEKWESRGEVIRYALTLTDIMHAEGTYSAHDGELVEAVLDAWAAAFGVRPADIISAVHHEFRSMVVDEIIAMASPESCPWDRQGRSEFRDWLLHHVTDMVPRHGIAFDLRLGYPLIPVGAPTPVLFPQLTDSLKQEVLISEWAPVANAVGAAAGDVVLQETAEIRVTGEGALVCSWRGGNTQARNLKRALDICEREVRELLRRGAEANDVPFCEPEFSVVPHEAESRDGKVLLGVTFTAELRE